MRLYHGSNIEIRTIDLTKSKPYKDFGKGFYLYAIKDQAKEMAQFKVSILQGNTVITEFEFDKDGLLNSDLKLLIFEDYTEEWLDFVINNREGQETEKFDFVFGPIADDRVGLQIRRFKDGSIDKKNC